MHWSSAPWSWKTNGSSPLHKPKTRSSKAPMPIWSPLVAQRITELTVANDALQKAHEQLKSNFITSIKVFSALVELRGGTGRPLQACGRPGVPNGCQAGV